MSSVSQKPLGQAEVWLVNADTESLDQLKIQRFKTIADKAIMPMSEPWYCKNDAGSLSRLNDKWKHAKQPCIFLLVGDQNTFSAIRESKSLTQNMWLGLNNQNPPNKRATLPPINALAHDISWLKRLNQNGIKATAGIGNIADSTQQNLTMPTAAVLVSQQEAQMLITGHQFGDLLPRPSHLLIVAACIALQFFSGAVANTDPNQQQMEALGKQIEDACPSTMHPLSSNDQP
ncbi:MAG: hypothetical protein LW629_06610 [Burkholderiales bacterium]|jgi:hypothetical protein|nr:hypothetical protein [Burkholderiales bacterium]